MTDNFRKHATRRSITLEARNVDAAREGLERRLVLAADADRRMLERELHDGVQQHLIALAVNLQLAAQSPAADPHAAKLHLAELGRDVQQALDEAGRLAQRIYPPLLDEGGLAAALRSAAVSAGVRVSLDVPVGVTFPPEIAAAVYWCCLAALEDAGARATVTVRDEAGAVAFEVVEDGSGSAAGLDRLRDHVEALGGRLTIRSEPGGTSVSGFLPLSE